MTVMDTATDTGVHQPAPTRGAEPAGRRGRRRLDPDRALRVEAQTIKAYRLGDDARRTVGYLRRTVNQRHIPDGARVTIDGERITVEWADE